MNGSIRKFSVWLVELEEKPRGYEQGGKRPFFVISSSEYNKNSKTPMGFICSTSSKNRFTEKIFFGNCRQDSYVNISQIRTLDSSRFIHCLEEFTGYEFGIKLVSKYINQMVFDGTLNDEQFMSILMKNSHESMTKELVGQFGKK